MGKLGLVFLGRALLSKSLIQFSVDGWDGCVPSLLFALKPNDGGGNENNGNLFQKVPCTHCHTVAFSAATLQQATTDPCLRWVDTHRKAWVSLLWGHYSFFFWVLVHTGFCLCPPRVCFPSPV